MKLTDIGLTRFVTHLQRMLECDCPACKKRSWNVVDEVMQLVPYTPQGTLYRGDFLPLLVVSCRDCGYTVLFNALQAKLLEVSDEATAIAVAT